MRAGVLSPALMPRRSIHTVRLPWPGAGVATIALLFVPTGQKRKPCTDIGEQSRHRNEQQPGKDYTHVLPDVQAGTWAGSNWQPRKAAGRTLGRRGVRCGDQVQRGALLRRLRAVGTLRHSKACRRRILRASQMVEHGIVQRRLLHRLSRANAP